MDTSSTADDAALGTKLVAEVNNVRVIFERERYTTNKRSLLSNKSMDRIDDPHYSVYTVENDDDDDANDSQKISYYKSDMRKNK